jgi:hypothetical protein
MLFGSGCVANRPQTARANRYQPPANRYQPPAQTRNSAGYRAGQAAALAGSRSDILRHLHGAGVCTHHLRVPGFASCAWLGGLGPIALGCGMVKTRGWLAHRLLILQACATYLAC